MRLSEGELLTVDSSIDVSTGTIKLKAVFPNDDNHLWPGQFVNVRLRLATEAGATTIPSPAVQRGPNGLYVFLLKPDNTVVAQPITVGQDDGQVAKVNAGVEPGSKVVTTGQSRLTNGTQVAATPIKPAT